MLGGYLLISHSYWVVAGYLTPLQFHVSHYHQRKCLAEEQGGDIQNRTDWSVLI